MTKPQKHKNTKGLNVCFCTQKKRKKKRKYVFAFCVITFGPIIIKTCEAPQKETHKIFHLVKKWPENVLKGHL